MADHLRPTDYLPKRFDGSKLDRDLCVAHFLTFQDNLCAHNLANPSDAAAVQNI